MPNGYFSFKQFTVQQQQCAMKVCTDACLFGAWVAANQQLSTAQNIVDIGTGTGLLALMLAQKNTAALIDAVEINEPAAIQAAANFQQCPWQERLHLHHSSIQQYAAAHSYDLIIANPPFFDNDLKSDNAERNLALHSTELTLQELLTAVNRLLADDGNFAVLLPFNRSSYFQKLAAEKNYWLQEKVVIQQTPRHSSFRSILLFSRKQGNPNIASIAIKNEHNQYSPSFTILLKDYYLHL